MSRSAPAAVLALLLGGLGCASESKPTGPGLELGPVQPCEAPAAAPSWTEQGAALGLEAPGSEDDSDGGGAAVGDIDGDGLLDLIFATDTEDGASVQLYWGRPGGFTRDSLPRDAVIAVGLADLDGDDRPELLLAGEDPAVLRWTGTDFTVVDELEGLGDELLRELLPVDLDGDGDLDLFGARSAPAAATSRDVVLWNEDGALELETDALPEAIAAREAFDALVLDTDGDTRPEVYVVNDMGAVRGPNVLWTATADALTDATGSCDCGLTMDGMGGSLADLDHDGAPDLFLTATSQNVLLMGDGDGGFVDTTAVAGADTLRQPGDMAWGAAWWDHDNDGVLALAVGQGDFRGDHAAGLGPQPFEVLVPDEQGVFEDQTAALGMAGEAWWRAVVPVELNGDGVLDLVASRAGERPVVFLSEGCTAAGWLEVAAPVGSRVEVTAGGTTQTAWVAHDPGFAAARPARAWFGLGAAAEVDRLRVVLPWDAGVVEERGFSGRRRVGVR